VDAKGTFEKQGIDYEHWQARGWECYAYSENPTNSDAYYGYAVKAHT